MNKQETFEIWSAAFYKGYHVKHDEINGQPSTGKCRDLFDQYYTKMDITTKMDIATPLRIQRKRVKGYKTPPNTIYVGRPTKWGNPFKVGKIVALEWFNDFDNIDTYTYITRSEEVKTAQEAVNLFEKYVAPKLKAHIHELNGKNLSCFCPIHSPCHADVLLKLANRYKNVG